MASATVGKISVPMPTIIATTYIIKYLTTLQINFAYTIIKALKRQTCTNNFETKKEWVGFHTCLVS